MSNEIGKFRVELDHETVRLHDGAMKKEIIKEPGLAEFEFKFSSESERKVMLDALEKVLLDSESYKNKRIVYFTYEYKNFTGYDEKDEDVYLKYRITVTVEYDAIVEFMNRFRRIKFEDNSTPESGKIYCVTVED